MVIGGHDVIINHRNHQGGKKVKISPSSRGIVPSFAPSTLRWRILAEEATMSPINILYVGVENNQAPFRDPLRFSVRYECLQDLKEGKRTYREP